MPGNAGAPPAASDGRGDRVTGAGSAASRVPTTADSERSTHARGFGAEAGASGGVSRSEGAEALDAARRAVAQHGDLTAADSRRTASGAGVPGQARTASGAGVPGAVSRGHASGAGLSAAGRTDAGTTETAPPANGVRHDAGTGRTGTGTTSTGTARFAATSTADDPRPTHLPGHSGHTTPHVPQQPRAEHRDTAPVTGLDAPSEAGRPSWATGHPRPHAASASEAGRTPGTAREADPAHAPAAPTTDHRGAAHLRSPASDASGTAHPTAGGHGGQHRTDALAARTPQVTARIPAEPEAAGDAPAPGPQTLYADGSPAAPAPAPGPDGAPSPAPGKRPRGRGIAAWARRLTGGRGDRQPQTADTGVDAAQPPVIGVPAETGPGRADARGAAADAASLRERWPDPAAVLLTALGPGPRLWERGPDHADLLTVRLGTADRYAPAPDTATGRTLLPAVPVTVALRQAGSLGLAGPRGRLAGLARSALAHLAALHSPSVLEFVLIAADPARPADRRQAEWAWLGWLPHLRPAYGQDCRLLVAYDREQAAARAAELVRRLDDGPLGPGWPTAPLEDVAAAADRHPGPYTVVIVDGDPGTSALRETVARLAARGAAAGIHLICLAEAPATTASSPVSAALETAAAGSPAFPHCGAVALLGGDVATVVQVIERTARPGDRSGSAPPPGGSVVAAVDAVSGAWAERFARALAPLRVTDADPTGRSARVAALPRTARLLDELGLARATPASLTARWAEATDPGSRPGGRAVAVLGAGPHGPLAVDLAADGPHLLVEGGPGSGKTELLRSLAASLAAADRPDRLSLVLVDGAAAERGEGLRVCTDLPHVSTYLAASDPVRMREFAQALGSELKRRAELLGTLDFTAWHERHTSPPPQVVTPRRSADPSSGDLDSPPTGTLRLRPARGGDSAARTAETALPRLVVLVDDYDALVAPALGSTGRPAAGSVVRALEAVARDGERLGIHLVAASGRPDRTDGTEAAERAALRAALEIAPAEAGAQGDGGPAPGRGRLRRPDDEAVTPFQAGRVTGRIPRTATLRPTVVPLDWQRMGDPPTRRPVRELGNGPTDLALLASALQRAAQSAGARPAPPLL
ncbi:MULTISPECIES: FtsK/SpoIIIE domain-containing protein [Streptomyces]|uniref:FtsK/SpoIIIE domain-containing protein n=1 Tax=Streptomyces TaxID=1883 RepID=UPI001C8DBD99